MLFLNAGIVYPAKVSKITYAVPHNTVTQEVKADTKIETEEQIDAALKKVRALDIKYDQYLIRIKEPQFDKFLVELQQWTDDHSQTKINEEKVRISRMQAAVENELKNNSVQFLKETDDVRKKGYENKIKNLVSKFVQLTLDKERLLFRIKKQDLSRYETELYDKEKSSANLEADLLARYTKIPTEVKVALKREAK
jgi:hypothetical protein